MDDSTDNPTAQSNGPVVQNNNQIPVQPPVTQSVSIANKEVQRPVSDYLTASETAPVIEQELREVGVEQVKEAPKLDQEHEQIGVKHSLENNVAKTEPTGFVKLPLTDEEIMVAEKEDDTASSAFWLAILISKIKRTIFWKK